MGWATTHIQRLREGHAVQFRPRGGSMAGRVESGQLCTVEPVDPGLLDKGDVVLCTVRGCQYLHLVKGVRARQWQIGNNRGGVNGWVGAAGIHGRLVRVED